MRIGIIVLLAAFWIYLAYLQFARGNMLLAGLFIVVGIVLTIYRLRG